MRCSPENILIYKVALAVATVASSHEGDSHELVVAFSLSVGQERGEREKTRPAPQTKPAASWYTRAL